MVLVPGCLFDISGHKVRFNSKGWASLKKGANLKITVRLFGLPGRCGRLFEEGGIWVSILRPSMFYLEIVERTRLKIKRTWFSSTSSARECHARSRPLTSLSCSARRFSKRKRKQRLLTD